MMSPFAFLHSRLGFGAAALNAFADALDKKKQELATALCREQGKPLAYAMGEVLGTIKKCRHLATIGDLKPEVLLENDKERIEVQYKPRGVVAGITPWNFPLAMGA